MITAITTIAKEEDDYLPFWLAWHLTAGFDKIIVHSHGRVHECVKTIETVNTQVIHRDAVRTLRTRTLQEDTNQEACERYHGLVDWMLCIDVDEFFFDPNRGNSADFFARIPEDVGQVVFNSQMFPKSESSDTSIPLVERCQYGAMQGHVSGHVCKHAIRPEALIEAGCHRSYIDPGFKTVHADLVTPADNTLNESYTEKIVWSPRIMHHPIKSDVEFERKKQRGYEWNMFVAPTNFLLQMYHPGEDLEFAGNEALWQTVKAKELMKTWGF